MSTTTPHSDHTFAAPAPGTSTQAEQRNRALAETGRLALPTLPDRPGIAAIRPGAGAPSTLGLQKFRDPLPQPPVLDAQHLPDGEALTIRALPTRVRVHADLPETTAWAYEGSIPGPTIEARRDHTVRIDWENALAGPHTRHAVAVHALDVGTELDHDDGPDHGHDENRAPLPYDVVRVPPQAAIPDTLRIALTPGGRAAMAHDMPAHDTQSHDTRAHNTHSHDMQAHDGEHEADPPNAYPRLDGTADLRAATVVHLHGAVTDGQSDGWAHSVMLPGHTARCTYPNGQEAATLWYHDHAMAITRFTVHAGLAGFYLIRDDIEDSLHLPCDERELVLAIGDRNLESEPGQPESFVPTGRLLYKQAGVGEGESGAEIPPTGPYTLVNGKIWPTHTTPAAWHRLRLLNASNARVYRLALYDTTDEQIPDDAGPLQANPDGGFGDDPSAYAMDRLDDALVVIGTDAGLLPSPIAAPGGAVELGPGERLDVLVNFGEHRGRTLELRNESATALLPQPGQTDPTVLQFAVDGDSCDDPFTLPDVLTPDYARWERRPDGAISVGDETVTDYQQIWVAVIPTNVHDNGHPQAWEMEDVTGMPPEEIGQTDVIRLERPDGRGAIVLRARAKLFDDTVGIMIGEGEWALWNVIHLGGPEHPIHIHMTAFQMLERRSWALDDAGNVPGFDPATGSTPEPLPRPDEGPAIDPVTAGTKDTWVVDAGEAVSFFGHFEGASGEFMYHCHILDHEDHTMMRPFVVLPPDVLALHSGHGGGHGGMGGGAR